MKKILLIICILAVIVFTGCGSSNTFVIKEINLELVKCPAGSFMMGSPEEEGRFIDEKTHLVTLTKHFYIGKYEVTQSQYSAIMDKNPSRFVGANNPVDTVSYEDAKAFCDKMNLKYLNILPKGYKFDLPTEAKWEYACRASTNTPFNNASKKKNIDEVAWYGGNSSDTTHIVGQKKPNAWGIYDMHGNVWEWCRDWDGEYPNEDVIDPIGVYSGSYRVSRGGGWDNDADEYEVRRCRSAYRHNGFNPDKGNDLVGFRIALVPIN